MNGNPRHHRRWRLSLGLLAASSLSLAPRSGWTQIAGEAERNVSRLANYQNECSMAVNPTDKNQLFAACNHALGGLFAARSTDRGQTWIFPDADRTIADGDAGQGNLACCDPTLAWDAFGNLFVTYLGNGGAIETILSTDGGQTFTNLATFAGNNDQPTVVAESTTAPGVPVAVWIVWNETLSGTNSPMRARGAAVTALGTVGAFGAAQTIPGTNNCSFGDVAIAPDGVVVQACETPTGGQGPGNILVNIDADGLGAGNFGAAITATATNVGGFDFIPAQSVRSIDAEPGLAYDRNPASPRFGRLYLVYTDEVVNEGNDTDIRMRFSDDDGANWSAFVRVNDDPAAPVRSQFLPRVATNPISGNIGVCWHDARNSAGNNTMREFCSLSTPTPATPTFLANVAVSAGTSAGTGSNPPVGGQFDIQYGDYSGLDYFQGRMHPIWSDQSNSLGDNPDLTTRWDAHSNRVGGGASANEGDPHIRTVDAVNYDFQAAGEFVALRGSDAFEVQTRQTAVATTFFPGPNPHTELATCVSLNTAVAVRVGKHRVTWQPRFDGVPDPSGLVLRVDGVVTALTDEGVGLSRGGRVVKTPVDGMEVELPGGGVVTVTPGFWSSQGKWYLNVGATGVDAYEGIMGAISPGGWLPALPDGSSMGPKPAASPQRYDDLNKKFADAWRVTKSGSLFDYAPGTSTGDFTLAGWPKDSPPCDVPNERPVEPATLAAAQQACRVVTGRARRANCVFDVRLTGEAGFAKTYARSERLERWGTTTILSADPRPQDGKPPRFVATVVPRLPTAKGVPGGAVQFYLHGKKAGEPVRLDRSGRALWAPSDLDWQHYRVSAKFLPIAPSPFLASTSNELGLPDRANEDVYQAKPN